MVENGHCAVGRGPETTKIWKPGPRFAYSLSNFQGATMMIKGSLLCCIPNDYKVFSWKISK